MNGGGPCARRGRACAPRRPPRPTIVPGNIFPAKLPCCPMLYEPERGTRYTARFTVCRGSPWRTLRAQGPRDARARPLRWWGDGAGLRGRLRGHPCHCQNTGSLQRAQTGNRITCRSGSFSHLSPTPFLIRRSIPRRLVAKVPIPCSQRLTRLSPPKAAALCSGMVQEHTDSFRQQRKFRALFS